jgi:hypothetical protein
MKPLVHRRGAESGYALVLVMFFLALLVLTTVAAAPTVLSNIQREKEVEMVWRGKQYARAIRLYSIKMNRLPTSLDDLTKPKTGLRFMRQAYKDPMNGIDGSWRLIYLGPNGQLVGSLKDPGTTSPFGQMAQSPAGGQGMGSSVFASQNSFGSGNSAFGNSNSASSVAASLGQNSRFGQNSSFGQAGGGTQGAALGSALQNSSPPTDPNVQNPDTPSDSGQPAPLGMMDASNTFGGKIVGVGSKVDKKSFLWFEKAKNYRQFEFVAQPVIYVQRSPASVGIGTPVQNQDGASPFGSSNSLSNPGINPNSQNLGGTPDPSGNTPLQAQPQNQ